ncbi:hypothetical protein ACXX9E_29755 [Pseudomonas sp. GNP014]
MKQSEQLRYLGGTDQHVVALLGLAEYPRIVEHDVAEKRCGSR